MHFHRLLAAFRDIPTALAAWHAGLSRSPMRGPCPLAAADIAPLAGAMIEALADALPSQGPDGQMLPGGLLPGSPWARELEKTAAFLGASMAAMGAAGFDVAAAVLAVRDAALRHVDGDEAGAVARMSEWLAVLALDAFAGARAQAAHEATRAMLEQRTPVVLLAPGVPGVFLVGAPDGYGIDSIFERLVFLLVRTGARVVVVDASGMENALAPGPLEAMARFLGHKRVAGKVRVAFAGVDPDAEPLWGKAARAGGTEVVFANETAAAIEHALAHAGLAIRPRTP